MFTTAELLRHVEAIYAGILDQTAWEAAIAGLCRALDGEVALLVATDRESRQVRTTVFVDVDGIYRKTYFELSGLPDMDGFYRAFAAYAHRGALIGDELALAAPDFHRSRFHAEWLRTQRLHDYIMAPLGPTPEMVGGLNIGRRRHGNAYGDRELEGLAALRPHLLRACQVRLRLEDAAGVAAGALAALDRLEQGVVLVDAGAGIVYANRAAEAALDRKDGLGAARSVLACDHADDTATLRRLVGEASARTTPRPGGSLAIRRRSGRRSLSALVAPLRGERRVPTERATAMVLVADPEAAMPSAGDCLRETYGLTAAEARVVEALPNHARLADVAASLGVRLATVRTLLQRAFDKTDTHRQADLVRLMLAQRVPAAED